MSDLISRKKVIDILEKEKSLRCSYDADITIFSIEKGIRELPTSYSVDKVVDELKTDSSVKLYGSGNSDNYLIPVKRAIEIVKHVGVGTETETIRDKAVKWNNNSSKRVPYEFIDYVEGKREIGGSDDVCEWELKNACYTTSIKHYYSLPTSIVKTFNNCPYCGKKIKIVGD